MKSQAVLHFFCGKLAAGKSTLSKKVALEHNAILISEDIWLAILYPTEIKSFEDYLQHSGRLKTVLFEHVNKLLTSGASVVLDFPGNTVNQRSWFRAICESAHADHILHYIESTDELCRLQLQKRNQEKPLGSIYISETQFDEITKYFQVPSTEEGFIVKKYETN